LSAESSHKWSKNDCDWGFREFMPLAALLDPQRGFVVNDTVRIKVNIAVKVRQGPEVHCEAGEAGAEKFSVKLVRQGGKVHFEAGEAGAEKFNVKRV
jgi:hypothetical protein